jgi:hypothetical protein
MSSTLQAGGRQEDCSIDIDVNINNSIIHGITDNLIFYIQLSYARWLKTWQWSWT